MEDVVYLLGAGFSAPLGLPVINHFYIKSKDLYFMNLNKYGYFLDNIFAIVDQMSLCKNYYNADLFNVEEILSILEMQATLGKGDADREAFIR